MGEQTDFCGCDTTLTAEALSSWERMVRAFLAHGASTPEHLGATLDLAPDFAQGHAVRGLFCLLLGRKEMVQTARDARAKARKAADRVTPNPREMAYLASLDAFLEGNPSVAAQHLEQVLEQHPRDALAMKLVQGIRFILGQPDRMRASIEQIADRWADHPALGYLKGCHAFTLEETGDYSAAERTGREGLLLAPDDAWGLHAVAHVYDMTARPKSGLAWLSERSRAWKHCNNFRYHVWWHIALMHLDLGDFDKALDLYDSEIRADRTDDYRDIANAASLLSRLELEGVEIGTRWDELAMLAEHRTDDAALVFADLHYLLALIGGRRDAAVTQMLSRMARDGTCQETEIQRLTEHPGLTAANGLEAFGEGRHAEAFVNLVAASDKLQSIGGSHAQRDVFERLTIEAALRAGLLDAAEKRLRLRVHHRGGAEDGYTARRMALIASGRLDAQKTAHAGGRFA